MSARRHPLSGKAALGVLAASALVTNLFLFKQAVQGNTDLTRGINGVLGPWVQVETAAPTPGEIQGLETRDIIKRVYSDGSVYIELVVAYIAHSSRKSAHAQEACLRGSGALVSHVESRQLTSAPVMARSISLDIHDQRQQVYYWYKIGKLHTADYMTSSLKMFFGGVFGRDHQGTALVRLLTPVRRGESPAAVESRLEDFAGRLVPDLEKHLP